MSKIVDNINSYIENYSIKKTFLSKQTNIEKNKLSRILNNIQEPSIDEIEKISEALGKKMTYFMQDTLSFVKREYQETSSVAFYMGSPNEEKKELANQVFEFLECIDAIMGVQKKLEKSNTSLIGF